MMEQEGNKQNDEFYVGYKAHAPASFAKQIRLFVGVLLLVIPILAFVITKSEGEFATSTFELGQLTELEGVLTMKPVPMLKMDLGTDNAGKTVYQSVLLIGFGKFGAESTIFALEAQIAEKLEGKKVKLEGTLIYHDGKTLLELTKKKTTLKYVEQTAPLKSTQTQLGEIELSGEIADPKCFFGVMKPGAGKPHRSCAVRCISGGIPPVFKAVNANNEHQYFLLKGVDGEPINKEIIPLIGEGIKLKGQLSKIDDWFILRIDPKKIVRTTPFLLGNAPMCDDGGQLTKR